MTTPRLIVRRFAPADLDDFMAFQAHPEVRRYVPGEAMDRARAERYLAEQAALPEEERGRWHGFAVERAGRVVGEVGVFLRDEEGDVGFQFHPDAQGRGYASEATRALLDCLFREFDLRRVTAGCDPRNAASFRLLERLGMRRVRETDEGLGYELTREAWNPLPCGGEGPGEVGM